MTERLSVHQVILTTNSGKKIQLDKNSKFYNMDKK